MKFKGQYFSFDAMIAAIIFILTLVSLLSYWHSVRLSLENQHDIFLKDAFRISELLLSPGYPTGVACDKMEEVGLGISFTDKRLNLSKINCVYNLAASIKGFSERLGTSNEVSIVFTDYEGKELSVIGIPPQKLAPDDVVSSAKVRRLASIFDDMGDDDPTNDKEIPASMDVYVYRVQ